MSKGPGRIQRSIVALIESNPNGAWTTSDLCLATFTGSNRVEKKHRIAVARALRTMVLPEGWFIAWGDRRDTGCILYNKANLESVGRRNWISTYGQQRGTFEGYFTGSRVADAQKDVDEYRRYFDADPLGRVDILIANEGRRTDMAKAFGFMSPQLESEIAANLERLAGRRAELATARISVSESSTFPSGNTYEVPA